MKFICYHHLNELPKNNIALFKKAAQDSLFFSREWFENLIKTTLDDQQYNNTDNDNQKLLIACVVDKTNSVKGDNNTKQYTNHEAEVLAILPLITRDNKEWSSLCHAYSNLYSLILSDNNQDAILNCLCKGLKDLPFDYLTIQPVAHDDKKIRRFEQTMEKSGFSSHQQFRAYNWFHQTKDQTFEAYIATRPSQLRNTLTRKQRKLKRQHGYDIRLHINNDIEKALTDYHNLYKVSWKANEQHENIVRGFTDKASTSGWTRLAILYVNGQPIAAQLWFVIGRKANIFRLVYDQHWQQFSPGTILMAYLMEYVIDQDNVEEIDFLSGNDRYKQDWMSERRERYSLTFVKKVKPKDKVNLSTKISRAIKKLSH